MERKPPPEILQLKAVCITLPFCIKYNPTGPPNSTRGLPSFYLYDKCYAYECVLFYYFRLEPGSTCRPGGLPPSTICRLLQSDK